MRISWIKSKADNESFKVFKSLGFDVNEIEDPEETDKAINKLVSEDYKTIIITNELAGFSEDIIKKYDKSNDINIIIAPRKER